ncbi:hypothetical protein RB195_000259 [Necator americanus]|uniref:Uncharacterized protein n=1 Tax=Necator americanus TaxID=51031 RepID=A0ABR1D9L4_NECAM
MGSVAPALSFQRWVRLVFFQAPLDLQRSLRRQASEHGCDTYRSEGSSGEEEEVEEEDEDEAKEEIQENTEPQR